MPEITEAARSALAGILERGNADAEMTLRLVAGEAEGLEIVPGTRADEDEAFEHDGRTVLVVAPAVAEQLGGALIDAETTDEGGIVLRLVRRRNDSC